MSANFERKPVFRVIYKETFKPLKSWVLADLMPVWMPHLNKDLRAQHIELRAAGHCTLNGKEYEFQDIRVYVDMTAVAQRHMCDALYGRDRNEPCPLCGYPKNAHG